MTETTMTDILTPIPNPNDPEGTTTRVLPPEEVYTVVHEWIDRHYPHLRGTGASVGIEWRAKPSEVGPNAKVALHLTFYPPPAEGHAEEPSRG